MSARKLTYTYKSIGACEIRADLYPAAGDRCPVLVWIHGGALIMGSRADLPEAQRDMYLDAGCAVASIDYRLAPETKLPAIADDMEDACRWVRDAAPQLLRADPHRMAVIGHSAGGYLALLAGARLKPPPNAVISFYGYGDIVAPWYTRPDPFYCRQPPVSRQEAYRSFGKRAISGTPDPHDRGRFYLYCRQQGRWPQEVSGHDHELEPEFFRPFCPIRNITSAYPPTLLLHGDRDTDVPYEQSVMMAQALARAGVEHELITIPDGDHGFDSVSSPVVAAAFSRALAFLGAHLR